LRTRVGSLDSKPTKRPSPEIEFRRLSPLNVSVGLRVVMPSVLPVLRSWTNTSKVAKRGKVRIRLDEDVLRRWLSRDARSLALQAWEWL
jgi:hypothetical protein